MKALLFFFVISGYLVGGLAVTRYPSHGFDFADFTIHRVSRIYTVLVPALLLGGLLDWLGLIFFNSTKLYTTPAHVDFIVANQLNIPTLITNLANLQGIAGPRFGSNGPLWSLAFEWWYYVIFAASMTAAIRGPVPFRILAGVALVVIATFMPHLVIVWGLMWLAGLASAVYAQSKWWKPPGVFASLLFGLALVGSRFGSHAEGGVPSFGLQQLAQDMGVAVAFAALILAFQTKADPLPFAGLHERLASFSYTLYLVHFPVLLFLVAALHDSFGLQFNVQPSALSVAYLAMVISFLCFYAWMLSLVTEAHTSNVREALMRLVRPNFVPLESTEVSAR